MSREIRFRAWDKIDSKMRIVARFYFSSGNNARVTMSAKSRHPNNVELMQYSGLKDKNGVEIYEGDIVEKTQYNKNLWRDDKKPMQVRYVVKWKEQKHDDNEHNNKVLAADPSSFAEPPGFTARQVDYENTKKFGYHSWSPFANSEVIGNIYENPELLEHQGSVMS